MKIFLSNKLVLPLAESRHRLSRGTLRAGSQPATRRRKTSREVLVAQLLSLTTFAPGPLCGFGYLFNDGKIDVVINCIDHTPVLLGNVNADSNRWVGIALTGGAEDPRDAIGAKVFVTAGGIRRRGDASSLSGAGYGGRRWVLRAQGFGVSVQP